MGVIQARTEKIPIFEKNPRLYNNNGSNLLAFNSVLML